MKRKTKEKGITLVSLAVTIIVILILAAVTVRIALGDGGVLDEAQLAANEWDKAVTGEQSDLAKLANEMRKARNGIVINGGSSSGGSTGGEGGNTGGNTGGDNNPSGGTKPGQAYGEETKITVDGKPVTVPGGATISGVEGENTVDGGLVIYIIPEGETVDWSNAAEVEYAQKTFSQFVWVPVENAVLDLSNRTSSLSTNETIKAAVELEISRGKYPMAIKKDDVNYIGVLYDFAYDGVKDEVLASPYSSWDPLGQSYREPMSFYQYNKAVGDVGDMPSLLNHINAIAKTNYTSSDEFGVDLQNNFNNMVKSVESKGGFWIGRYRTSTMSDTTDSYIPSNEVLISSVKGSTANITAYWHKAYGLHSIYTKKANITGSSSMIWGSQWDQLMMWLKDVKNTTQGEYVYYVIKSTGMYSAETNVKNIYDLSAQNGNNSTFTIESGINKTDSSVAAYNKSTRTARGGGQIPSARMEVPTITSYYNARYHRIILY